MKTYIATYKDEQGEIWNYYPMANNLAEAKAKASAQAEIERGLHTLKMINVQLATYELYVVNHRTGKEEHVSYHTERNGEYSAKVFQLKISRGNHEEICWRLIPNSKKVKK